MKTILNYLQRPLQALVEARRKHAAWHVANVLKESKDFRHMSSIDLYHKVLGDMKEAA